MKLAIVGAGLAGLSAAHLLRRQELNIDIVLFEKSRGVGGRAATRRSQGALFDHGAQYIKAPTPELLQLLEQTLAHDTLVDIGLPVWTFDKQGQISSGDSTQNADPKWTYSDGITRIAKELALDLDIRFETRITRLAQANGSYLLFNEDGTILSAADAVLVTLPAPQAQMLIAASELPQPASQTLADELGRAPYRRCLTLTLGYSPMLSKQPFYALVNTDKHHPISWLAYEHLKPSRDTAGQHVLIAQMAPLWSVEHWDDPLLVLTTHVAELVSVLLDEDVRTPNWSNRQGWRYALPDGRADFEALNTTLPGLFFAGDYTAGQGRVHLAIEQGWRVAERIASFAQQ